MVTAPKDPTIEFPLRLRQALDAAGFLPEGEGRQQQIATRFKVSQQAAGKWLRGETLPEFKRVIEIAVATGFTVDWLMTGRGPERALRKDELVRMDEHGEVTVLRFQDSSAGAEARAALTTGHAASSYQVVRHDPVILLDMIAGAVAPFGLEVTEASRIDAQRGLLLHATWKAQPVQLGSRFQVVKRGGEISTPDLPGRMDDDDSADEDDGDVAEPG